MTLKTVASKTGNGLLDFTTLVVTAAHDGPRKERIEAIDATIKMLNEERTRLTNELIEKN